MQHTYAGYFALEADVKRLPIAKVQQTPHVRLEALQAICARVDLHADRHREAPAC